CFRRARGWSSDRPEVVLDVPHTYGDEAVDDVLVGVGHVAPECGWWQWVVVPGAVHAVAGHCVDLGVEHAARLPVLRQPLLPGTHLATPTRSGSSGCTRSATLYGPYMAPAMRTQ